MKKGLFLCLSVAFVSMILVGGQRVAKEMPPEPWQVTPVETAEYVTPDRSINTGI